MIPPHRGRGKGGEARGGEKRTILKGHRNARGYSLDTEIPLKI